MLSDELWSKLQEIMLQHRIYDKPNLRMMVEAILYRMRVGCPCNQRNLSDIITLSPTLYQGKEMKSFYAYIMASGRVWMPRTSRGT